MTQTATSNPSSTITITPTKYLTQTPIPTPTSTGSDQKPILSMGIVDPETGNEETIFEYRVHYSDPDGGAPSIKRVFINGVYHTMDLNSGNPWDGFFTKTIIGSELNIGNNVFYFYFIDDESNLVYLPVTSVFNGPIITQINTPTPTITPVPTDTPILLPLMDLFANGSSFDKGDTINISVKVENNTFNPIDMYTAIPLSDTLYWYPIWDEIPHPTRVTPGLWVIPIAAIQVNDSIPNGTYTFYAAITKHDSYDLLGFDSVEITIN